MRVHACVMCVRAWLCVHSVIHTGISGDEEVGTVAEVAHPRKRADRCQSDVEGQRDCQSGETGPSDHEGVQYQRRVVLRHACVDMVSAWAQQG